MSYIREKAVAGLKRGDSFTVSRTFTQHDTLAFADIGRDYNPVHFDQRFAEAKSFMAGFAIRLFDGEVQVRSFDMTCYIFDQLGVVWILSLLLRCDIGTCRWPGV